jgi:hypothetical protein
MRCLIIVLMLVLTAVPGAAMDNKVQQIADNIAKTPYDIKWYNCWDYATDLYVSLRYANYTPRIVIGMYTYNTAHSWISLNGEWIEATTGKVIADRSLFRFGYWGIMKFNPFKTAWLALNR